MKLENKENSPVQGIMILGSSGAGKTTVGTVVAQKLNITLIDIDEYIWRKDTPIPFTSMYSKEEKIDRLLTAVKNAGEFVMTGSMNSFHTAFDGFFTLAIYLTADEKQRVERVHQRELQIYGDRLLPDGDMYESHQEFLQDVAGYEHGCPGCNQEQHEAWLQELICPILRLDGGQSIEENASIIVKEYLKIKQFQ